MCSMCGHLKPTDCFFIPLFAMCNCYDLSNKHIPWHAELERTPDSETDSQSKPKNIRKTDKAVVGRSVNHKLEALSMRWGFYRNFNTAINNTRADKLDGGMWSEAWREHRCVVPMSAYYEWSGPKGGKQTHAFVSGADDWLWAAGVWEENAELGFCYSLITVDASPVAEPIHNRMPALLDFGDIDEFLSADDPREMLRPYEGRLKTFPCLNPLKMESPGPPVPMEVDQELF